jgi:hypothetical protein
VSKREFEFIAMLVGCREDVRNDVKFPPLLPAHVLVLIGTELSAVDDFGSGRGILTKLESNKFGWRGGVESVDDERLELGGKREGGKEGVHWSKDTP